DGAGCVVHRDVVLDVVVTAGPLDVDPVRAVEVDGVSDDPASGDVEVVDAVVTVVIADVAGDERVVPAGVDIDPSVLVRVRNVADDGVPRCYIVDAVRVSLVLIGVVVRRVALHRDAGCRSGQQNAVASIVVCDVALDEPAVQAAEVDAGGGLPGFWL